MYVSVVTHFDAVLGVTEPSSDPANPLEGCRYGVRATGG